MSLALVKELELKLLDSNSRKDVDFLNAVLSDDFFECGASGTTFDKSAVLDSLPKELEEKTFKEADLTAKFLSESVIQTQFRITIHPEDKRSYRTSIWVKEEASWRMIYHQGTPLPN